MQSWRPIRARLSAKLGLARLYLQQGEANDSAKKIVEIFNADPSFPRFEHVAVQRRLSSGETR